MKNSEIKKLKDYLYPTEEIEHFLIKEINPKLKQMLQNVSIFAAENEEKKIRKQNYDKFYFVVCELLFSNETYLNNVKNYWGKLKFKYIIDDIIINYVFNLTQQDSTFKNVDIFKNKQSICYRKISVLSFI